MDFGDKKLSCACHVVVPIIEFALVSETIRDCPFYSYPLNLWLSCASGHGFCIWVRWTEHINWSRPAKFFVDKSDNKVCDTRKTYLRVSVKHRLIVDALNQFVVVADNLDCGLSMCVQSVASALWFRWNICVPKLTSRVVSHKYSLSGLRPVFFFSPECVVLRLRYDEL